MPGESHGSGAAPAQYLELDRAREDAYMSAHDYRFRQLANALPPTEVLGEVHRIMREGGTLILSVPNIATPYNRVKLLLGKTPLGNPDDQLNGRWVHGYGHIHEYTTKEISCLVERCGSVIVNRRLLQEKVSALFHGVERAARPHELALSFPS
jgi:hypothetical protein